jgi:hypothetical protein
MQGFETPFKGGSVSLAVGEFYIDRGGNTWHITAKSLVENQYIGEKVGQGQMQKFTPKGVVYGSSLEKNPSDLIKPTFNFLNELDRFNAFLGELKRQVGNVIGAIDAENDPTGKFKGVSETIVTILALKHEEIEALKEDLKG